MAKFSGKLIGFVLFFTIGIVGIGYYTASQPPVEEGNIGLRYCSGKLLKTYQSGEKGFALPLLERYLTLSAEPKNLHLAGTEALLFHLPEKEEILLEAQLVYTIMDLHLFLEKYGLERPESQLKNDLRKALSEKISDQLINDSSSINNTRNRMLLIAGLLVEMNELFSASGVQLDNFELSVK